MEVPKEKLIEENSSPIIEEIPELFIERLRNLEENYQNEIAEAQHRYNKLEENFKNNLKEKDAELSAAFEKNKEISYFPEIQVQLLEKENLLRLKEQNIEDLNIKISKLQDEIEYLTEALHNLELKSHFAKKDAECKERLITSALEKHLQQELDEVKEDVGQNSSRKRSRDY